MNIRDSLGMDIIDEELILGLLQKNQLDPIGHSMDKINPLAIEEVLIGHPLVHEAQCYKTSGNMLRIDICGKAPLVRVMNNRGQDFYVDSHGEILSQHTLSVQLPVATGYIDREFAQTELLDVVRAIEASDFWKAQIEQIDVAVDGEIRMVPRVGDHLLILGSASNVEQKLERLMSFYKNGLDKIGWNKYRSISVAYENQVVCKKRK